MPTDIKPSRWGWILTKHGRFLNTPERTKRSLLIGYDLVTLKGLRKTERELSTPPYAIVRVRLTPDPKGRIWSVAVNGQLSMRLAAWTVLEKTEERAMAYMGFYILDARVETFQLSKTTRKKLFHLYCKKKLTPKQRVWLRDFLRSIGHEVVRCRYEKGA